MALQREQILHPLGRGQFLFRPTAAQTRHSQRGSMETWEGNDDGRVARRHSETRRNSSNLTSSSSVDSQQHPLAHLLNAIEVQRRCIVVVPFPPLRKGETSGRIEVHFLGNNASFIVERVKTEVRQPISPFLLSPPFFPSSSIIFVEEEDSKKKRIEERGWVLVGSPHYCW